MVSAHYLNKIAPSAIAGLSIIFLFYFSNVGSSLEVESSLNTSSVIRYAQYPADFSNDRILVGASHNIFVGRVIAQIGTKERGVGPETQFEIEVIDNVKGNLQGVVTINQQGGYRDGKSYLIAGDVFTEGKEEETLLQVESTYLFSTRYNDNENWLTVISYPEANKILSSEETDKNELKKLSRDNLRARALREAYLHEIPLQADVRNNNVRNPFNSETETNTLDNVEAPVIVDEVINDEPAVVIDASLPTEIAAESEYVDESSR